ncbi:hypothetical protein amrb99_12640 [Actinomadura sp. RB99]|nr:hypothetical protein [Actinomadura sp. RB99]
MVAIATNRSRSMAIMTGHLRPVSIHGPVGIATRAPTIRLADESKETLAGLERRTLITIRPKAPNPRPEPYALTAYAAHSHPNCRPSFLRATSFLHQVRPQPLVLLAHAISG